MRIQAFVTRVAGLFFISAVLTVSPWIWAQEVATTVPAASTPATVPAPAQIRRGLDLFQGTARFSAGGPSCNSCHNVVNDAVIGGGTLAADLTESFGRVGAEGILAMLPRKGAPSPFPVMQAAFQDRTLTDEESLALVAFLQDANARRATQKPNDLGPKMLTAGVVGVAFLLLLFSLLGRGRKRRSVNQDIYDRQIING